MIDLLVAIVIGSVTSVALTYAVHLVMEKRHERTRRLDRRQRAAERRHLLAALTPADRDWLTTNGWQA